VSAPTWPEDVGRAILAAGVPWLPGALTDRGERVWQHGQGDDWPDMRDDATRGAVRGWLSDRGPVPYVLTLIRWHDQTWRAAYGLPMSVDRADILGIVPPDVATALAADWREADARALLALALEVLAMPCGHPVSAVVASGRGPGTTNHCGACAQEGSES